MCLAYVLSRGLGLSPWVPLVYATGGLYAVQHFYHKDCMLHIIVFH